MGSDPIAIPLLDCLCTEFAETIELAAIYTQPDRPRGRGLKIVPNEIAQWATRHHIPTRKPERCGADEEEWFRENNIRLALVMAYGQILKRTFIETPSCGTYNFHASLLPQLRGASPINTAIAIGDSRAGVSLMRIIPKLDAGPIIDQEEVSIPTEVQAPQIYTRIAQACLPLIRRNLQPLLDQSVVESAQNPQAVTYCRLIQKSDSQLDFHRSAQALHDHIRGFQPWPGAAVLINERRIRILQTQVIPFENPTPGKLMILDDQRIQIQCGNNALEILELQRDGGKPLIPPEFLRGCPLSDGIIIPSQEMKPLVSKQPFPYKKNQ